MRMTRFLILTAAFSAMLHAQEPPASVGDDTRGYNDTPIIVGQKWRVHDMDRPRPAKVAPGPYVSSAPPADLSSELQNLRAQLQEIKSTLQGARAPEAPSSEAEELFEELTANDLARDIARETVSAAVRLREQLSRDLPAQTLPLRAYAEEMISKRLRFAPPFQTTVSAKSSSGSAQAVVFVGPAGAGKTTTLIKIAIRECLAQRQPVRIISMDPYRVAAHEKLRNFASIIGV